MSEDSPEPMADFQRALEASKVPSGGMTTVEFAGDSVLVVNSSGKLFAMGAICTHEQWDLSEGTVDGTTVTCAGHGSVGDLATGKAEFDEPLDDEPLYDVKVEGGWIMLRKR